MHICENVMIWIMNFRGPLKIVIEWVEIINEEPKWSFGLFDEYKIPMARCAILIECPESLSLIVELVKELKQSA